MSDITFESVKTEIIKRLHNDAKRMERDAIQLESEGVLHKMHERMSMAASLRVAANYLDGVQGPG